MIATTHPLAVDAGARVLGDGGTAVEAAVAAAAVLCVVEPMSVSPGGDLFAQVWEPGAAHPTGLAAAGWAGSRAGDVALEGGALDGPPAVTVPGAVGGWNALLDRYGSLGVERVLEPATRAALDGFEVTPTIAEMWGAGAVRLSPSARATFLVDGRSPKAGESMRNPALGRFLKDLADEGLEWFYSRDMAERIVAVLGGQGLLTVDDVTEWPGPEWVDPLRGSSNGYDVYEMPPPGQGLIVLEALAMYERLGAGVDADHLLIECTKLALEDASEFCCDPLFGRRGEEVMLDPERIEQRARDVSPSSARPTPTPGGSDTVFVAAVDRDGRACSLIQSIYMHFGSGIEVPGTGVLLHNRGANFKLRADHPNRLEPRKRPLHTILPAMVGRAGAFHASLGVVGAFMQPQGQLQILVRLLHEEATPTEALGAPRWRILGDRLLGVEDGFDRDRAARLRAKGHHLVPLGPLEAGGAQAIVAVPGGLRGASEPRRDGAVRRVG
jgi:gamma-glutamyltranspeptidase/glutathione hydrolase